MQQQLVELSPSSAREGTHEAVGGGHVEGGGVKPVLGGTALLVLLLIAAALTGIPPLARPRGVGQRRRRLTTQFVRR